MLFNQKGQIEFIIIIGLLAIALVGIFYVFQSGIIDTVTTPQDIKEEQNLVKDFVVNIIRDGTVNTLRTLETHGGYLNPDQMSGYVFFARRVVPYWQQCQNDVSPSKAIVTERLGNGIKNHIINSLQGVNEVYGKETTFNLNELNVEATIHRSKVDITVNMPTKVRGYLIREPFTTTTPTMFGRIIDFAKNFAIEAKTTRFWETYTSASIEMSDLPRFGLLTNCGQVIFWDQIKIANSLEAAVKYTVANTELWRQTEILNNRLILYGIEDVNAETYPDLDIKFKLNDGFSLNVLDPVIIMNTRPMMESSVFPLPPICVSVYEQNYSVTYPVVIRVFDTLLNDNFYFSSLVYVDRMEKGSCEEIAQLAASCENAACNATITVEDSSGSPLDGTIVYLGGCSLNITNNQGVTKGPAPCGLRRLTVYYSPEYEFFSEEVQITPTFAKSIELHKKANITFNFVSGGSCGSEIWGSDLKSVQLNLTSTERPNENYIVSNGNPDFDFDGCMETRDPDNICDTCLLSISNNNVNENACTTCGVRNNLCLRDGGLLNYVDVDYIPGGQYIANIMITNPSVIATNPSNSFMAMPIKTVTKPVTIPEEDKTINFYLPDTVSIYNDAKEAYDEKYGKQTSKPLCWARTCRCDEDCAMGLGLQDAMDVLDDLQNFNWEVC